MLPRAARLREPGEFRATVRGGARAARPTLVIHARQTGTGITQVGFVVSKAVGNAVVRNRVRRRLRHLVAGQLVDAPQGLRVVVRALPPSATAGPELANQLQGAWSKALSRIDN